MSKPFDPLDSLTEIQEIPQAEVEFGDVTDDDQLSLFEDDEGIWVDYLVVNRYEKDYHRYMMGITSPDGFLGDSAAFVQLASPTLLWVADWTAAKYGERPKIPDPVQRIDDWVLLDEQYEPSMLAVASDGVTPIYRISGTYVYGHRRPSLDTINDLVFPQAPWITDGLTRTVDPDQLDQDIISNNSQSALTTG